MFSYKLISESNLPLGKDFTMLKACWSQWVSKIWRHNCMCSSAFL